MIPGNFCEDNSDMSVEKYFRENPGRIPVVVLCGGTGTRLREQTEFTPKPMIPIGGVPMVVHIMRWYEKFGYQRFVLALGYKQEVFKQYFHSFDIFNQDIQLIRTEEVAETRVITGDANVVRNIILTDTGERTLKGGRLKRVAKYILDAPFFMLTYGDGVTNVNLDKLLEFHINHGKMVTVTGVHPAPKFGEIHHEGGKVISFSEKPIQDGYLVNGGFMVCNRELLDLLTEDEWCDLEVGPLELVANKGQMMVYEHRGFWQNMDTMNDILVLQEMWRKGDAPWKV